MKIAYCVANGVVNELRLVKETPRFYKVINSSGVAESMSKSGYKTRGGMRSFFTTDPTKAREECKKQINKISEMLDEMTLELVRLKKELNIFAGANQG